MVTMHSIFTRLQFRIGLLLMLWVWLATVLVVNLPGHLTHDSLTQIAEGRSGFVRSWNPIFSSWIFGSLVNWTGGSEALVAVSATMLAASVYLLVQASPSQRLWPLIPSAALLFTPILLIHPGIVWKDVWFAHLSLLGFGMVALRAQGSGWWTEFAAIALLAAGMLSRQTGVLVAVIGLVALSVLLHPAATNPLAGWLTGRRALAFAGRLVLLLAAANALSFWARSDMKHIEIGEVGTGFKLVAFFDMAGMLQADPGLRLQRLKDQGFETGEWEAAARASFSAERIDRLDLRAMNGPRDLTAQDILQQWFSLVVANPITYVTHRLQVYSWFGGLQDQRACIPIHVGVDAGPLTPDAGIKAQAPRMSPALYRWSRDFVGTPYFAPLAWSGLSLLVGVLLLWAGLWRDPVFWVQVAGLGYSASYLIAGFSCDFRYSYFSVTAASIGIIRLCWGDWLKHRSKGGRPSPKGY